MISQSVKSLNREPRPLMVDSEIRVKDCKHLEFGNPSSHTFGTSFMFMTTVYLLIKHYSVKWDLNYEANKMRKLMAIILSFNSVFFVVYVIGFSRVFNGVHTYNQIINGFFLGTILGLMQCFIFYEDYFMFYLSLRRRTVKQLLLNKFVFWYLFIAVLGIIIHYINVATFEVPKHWT